MEQEAKKCALNWMEFPCLIIFDLGYQISNGIHSVSDVLRKSIRLNNNMKKTKFSFNREISGNVIFETFCSQSSSFSSLGKKPSYWAFMIWIFDWIFERRVAYRSFFIHHFHFNSSLFFSLSVLIFKVASGKLRFKNRKHSKRGRNAL